MFCSSDLFLLLSSRSVWQKGTIFNTLVHSRTVNRNFPAWLIREKENQDENGFEIFGLPVLLASNCLGTFDAVWVRYFFYSWNQYFTASSGQMQPFRWNSELWRARNNIGWFGIFLGEKKKNRIGRYTHLRNLWQPAECNFSQKSNFSLLTVCSGVNTCSMVFC